MADLPLKLLITSIQLKGFKSIDDIKVDIKKGLNILIGKNGSGKSNFLEGISQVLNNSIKSRPLYNRAYISYLTEDNAHLSVLYEKIIKNSNNTNEDDFDDRLKVSQKLFFAEQLVYDTSDTSTTIEVLGKKINTRGSLNVIIRRIGYFPLYPLLITFNIPINIECITIPGILNIEIDKETNDVWYELDSLVFIKNIFFNIEHEYSGENDLIRKIDSASFYKHLIIEPVILDNLKRFSPIEDIKFNENISVYHDDNGVIIDNIKIDFKINNNWIPWSQLSDGTKRLFYLIVEITSHQGGLVLLEEPELGVHPHQFSLVMDFLKEQSETKQIIISTHSPLALNHLDIDELDHVMIAKFDLKKGTQIKHLNLAQIKKAKSYIKDIGFFSDYWVNSDLE